MARWGILSYLLATATVLGPVLSQSSKPNVLVIMSDDQDMILDSLSVQPNIMKSIAAEGTLFENHYCTVAWCCPSRVNFFTGRAAHNTNVTALAEPYGGYSVFRDNHLDSKYLPVWINDTGVPTYYVGKFMNSYTQKNFNNPHPPAWTESTFLVAPGVYNYFHSTWTDGYTNTITPFPGIHTTNVTQTKALAFLDKAIAKNEQFFMMVAPVAPHLQGGKKGLPIAPPPPPEFKGVFNDRKVPRTPDFNPDVPSGASWVYKLPQLSTKQVQQGDNIYHHRLANLAGVDAMVGDLIQKLKDNNILDNTYIIYTTDNGFHISQHRMPAGKRCGYETDINIPLLIRGPGVPKNVTSTIPNSHTDMAPTILKMLGIPLQNDFDGQPIPYEDPLSADNEYVNVEFWNADQHGTDNDGDVDITGPGLFVNNTYKSLRLKSDTNSFYYSVWCDGEHEFYDMNTDYYQMHNLLRTGTSTSGITYNGRPVKQLFARLDTLLLVTKECKQEACVQPWGVLFPKGEATNLSMAMDAKYDDFFASQPAVSFSSCSSGHFIYLEGPQKAKVYSG